MAQADRPVVMVIGVCQDPATGLRSIGTQASGMMEDFPL